MDAEPPSERTPPDDEDESVSDTEELDSEGGDDESGCGVTHEEEIEIIHNAAMEAAERYLSEFGPSVITLAANKHLAKEKKKSAAIAKESSKPGAKRRASTKPSSPSPKKKRRTAS